MKKILSLLCIVSVLISLITGLPALASETVYSKGETFEMDGLTYSVTEGAVAVTSEAAFSGDTNTSEKIKIKHEALTDKTTLETSLSIKGLPTGRMVLSTKFIITAFEGDTETQGFCMESDAAANLKTGYFTKVTANEEIQYWRKAMLEAGKTDNKITLSFSGKGEVFLEKSEIDVAQGIINGDFEGLISETWVAGWTFSAKNQPNGFIVEADATGNHYVKSLESLTRASYLRQTIQDATIANKVFEEGELYTLSVCHKTAKGTVGGLGFSSQNGIAKFPEGSSGYANWTTKSNTWGKKTFTAPVFAANDTTRPQYYVTLRVVGDVCYFDNIMLEKATEKCILTNAENEEVKTVSPGKVKVSYEKPVKDFVNYQTPANFTDGEKTTKGRTVLAVLYSETDKGEKMLEEVQVFPDLFGIARIPTPNAGSVSSDYDDVGILPITAEANFDIKNDGKKYSIKVLTWDSVSGLSVEGEGFSFPAAE